MSTQASEARNEIDDEPEEGEIQDDEGSLEDVSSEDEISPLAKRKERGTYTSTLVTVRGQFVKTERQHLSCPPRRDMRLCSSERSDTSLKKSQTRAKSGCRTTAVLDSYYESVQRHKSSKDTQKVSGKIHEKENKAKELRKARKRSTSAHASGSETRNAYIGSELAEPCISSSTSSKGYWHKGDVKEKHRKKKKSSKSNKFSNPLGEVCASQPKTGNVSGCVDECVKSVGNAKTEITMSWNRTESEKEKSELSSPSSDIQILDVPLVVPEIITICDSDDEALKAAEGNCDINVVSAEEEGNVCELQLPAESNVSPAKEVAQNDDGVDPEDNLKLLREAALKSSKPETCVNVNRDDEVLQLRLAALRSAIVRKYEERKKRGITLAKTNRNAADKQVMSISPLGSPNYYSSGDSSVRASDDIDHDLNSSFEFSVSFNQERDVSEPVNDSEIDKISTVDMELAESDEEKDLVGTEMGTVVNCHETNEENIENECSASYKANSEPLERPDEVDYLIYPVDEPLAPVVSQDSSPSPSGIVCTIDPPAGYIIGDQDQERTSVFVSEIHEIPSPPSLFDPQSEITDSSREYVNAESLEDKIHPSTQRHIEQAPDQIHEEIVENIVTDETRNQAFNSIDTSNTVDFETSESRNVEPLDVTSNRSDSSFLSPVSGELDLESMIILDEIGKSSDEKSVCSTEEVFSSEKFHDSPCKDLPNFSEDCDSENIIELYEENSGVPISADNFEANDNTIIFEKTSRVNSYDVTSSRSLDENVHVNPENFETSGDIKMYENVPDVSLKILLSNSQGSCDLPSQNINEPSRLEVCDKSDNVAIYETSNLSSDSHSGTARVFEISSQTVGGVSALDNSENVLKFSLEDNGGSLSSLTEIEEGKSMLQCILSPACEDKTVCSSPDRETVHESSKSGNDFCSSLEDLQETDHTLVLGNTFGVKNRENISNSQDIVTEDDETVLRVSLLAMLKRRTEEQSNKLSSEIDLPGDALCASSENRHDSTSKNILPISLQTGSHTDSSCKSGHQNNSSLKQTSTSGPIESQHSFINALPKHGMFSPHNTSSLKMRGAKSNKLRGRDAKVPGRFNVNVPKLVINLGEDTDSGEDSESVKPVPISNLNGSDVCEESRDVSGSQSVPPDFEKKLDLLLKQARFQQEISTKDDKDILSENTDLAASCCNKVMKLQSTNSNADVGKNSQNPSVSSGSSSVHMLSISKIPPLVVQGANNQCGKNINVSMLSRNKMISSNNVKVTKTSVNRALDANKRDIHGRIKYTSAIAQQSSTVSSVVDIGLLPSSKQKEYIRLKRQLAQHARKEQEIKTKENVALVNTARLPVKKVEETKILVSADVRNSLIKNNVGIGAERSQFTRKFVRRGQGGTLISRTELGKSRRIVRSISSSYSSQTHLRNRLTVTTPNKVGGASLEGSSIVRRVLCMPQKRIVTSLTVKKVSPGFPKTTPSVNANSSDIQRKIISLNCKPGEHTNTLDRSLLQEKNARNKNESQETQISESVVETGNKVQKKCIGKTVFVRKGSMSDINGVLLRKKLAVEREPTKETNINETLLTKTDLKDISESKVDDGSTSGHSGGQESSVVKNTPLLKRKRSNSEQSVVTLRKKFIVQETSKQQSVLGVGSISKDSKKIDMVDRTLAEDLWYSESKLISKRYQVLEDIATVQLNLHEIERVSELRQQIIKNIQRLQKEMNHAETQLTVKDDLLKVLYSEVENAKRDIMRRQSETLLLSVECEDMGGKVHGSNYSVPNTCTDLIRNGMATISKTLQQLTDEKQADESEIPTLCSSGQTLSKMTGATQVNPNEITVDSENVDSEDSSKQNPRSYLSPLEAMRTAPEPSNDNQAVLCPYHIMGSCKDKECSYLH